MEGKENNSRKVFLSVLGVAILIVAVVGISYAAFTFTNEGAEDNTITTGTITMSYSEPEAGLSLTNELPMDDATGIGRSAVFDFTVSTSATGLVAIPYEVNMTPTFTAAIATSCTGGTATGTETTKESCEALGGTFVQGYEMLPASNVKVYLEAKTTGEYAQVLAPTTIAAKTVEGAPVGGLTASTIRTGSLVLHSTTDDYTAAAGNTTTSYRLRMWIDEDTKVDDWAAGTMYKYALKVNVDSHVDPLGTE